MHPQPSAGPHSHPTTITCHQKTLLTRPSNTDMLCPKDGLQKAALPEVTVLPLFPSLNRQPMFSLMPTLSFKQCLSLPKLLMPLCPLDCSFQLSTKLQEPVLSKSHNCYCLMRALRSHHMKNSGHQRKFQKWPQLSAFWRCLHLLTSSLGMRYPMLYTVFSHLPPSSLSLATWVLSQKQRRDLCPLPLE